MIKGLRILSKHENDSGDILYLCNWDGIIVYATESFLGMCTDNAQGLKRAEVFTEKEEIAQVLQRQESSCPLESNGKLKEQNNADETKATRSVTIEVPLAVYQSVQEVCSKTGTTLEHVINLLLCKWTKRQTGTVWRKLRARTLHRDHNKCIRCQKHFKHGRGLSAHHILPRDKGGEDYIGNLVSLCQQCHDYVETHLDECNSVEAIERSIL